MASHLSDVGFSVSSREELEALILQAVEEGEPRWCSQGCYVVWSPGNGVQLWAQVNQEGDLVGFAPHFDGPARLRATITRGVPDREFPLDGSLDCLADPEGRGDGEGPPFLLDLPDAALALAGLSAPTEGLLQVAAFAHDLRCHADERAFQASQDQAAVPLAPNYFIPAGLFTRDEEERPRAEALFAGRVKVAERLVNPVTGAPFWAMTVETLIGDLSVVAEAGLPEGEPVAGGLVEGTFWLSARLVGTA
ncbi:MAG: hypothetical protein ACOY93_02530 [Bacillota bacterium]